MTLSKKSKAEFREFLFHSALCPGLKEHLEVCEYCVGTMMALFETNRFNQLDIK